MRFAEVIGDPIAQSRSPEIHKYWLNMLDLSGDYRKTRVERGSVAPFLEQRSSNEDWLGCNVTIPHKEEAASLVEWLEPRARAIGAVNCIVPRQSSLAGYNSDVDGIEAALGSAEIRGRPVVVIGCGGAARAAVAYLAEKGAAAIRLLVRDRARAEPLLPLAGRSGLEFHPFSDAGQVFDGASVIINATPLGMAGARAMPANILEAIGRQSSATTLFDMVTTPALTPLLDAGRSAGAQCVDGLTMLVGQAARAFELFFGHPAPPPDQNLRDMLAVESAD